MAMEICVVRRFLISSYGRREALRNKALRWVRELWQRSCPSIGWIGAPYVVGAARRFILHLDGECKLVCASRRSGVTLMEFVESLTALLFSFLCGLLIQWLLLHGFFKVVAKRRPERIPGAEQTASGR